jgi:GNAT superfamily N-acetyltransferase
MQLHVRRAVSEDAPFLRAMIWQALLASPAFFARVGEQTLIALEDQSWQRWSAQPVTHREPAFVAMSSESTPVGALILKNDIALTAEDRARRAGPIEPGVVVERWRFGMGVVESARGKGVGRALLEHAFTFASDTGATELALLVDPGNAVARRLYDAMGFKVVGERDGSVEMRARVPR